MMVNNSIKDYIVIKENQYQDIETLKFNFVSFPYIQKKWALFAHALGFWGTSGYDTKIIGNNMNLIKSDSNYILQGKTNPYNPRESRVKIIFSNFKFEFIPETISTLDSITTDLTPTTIKTTEFVNRSNIASTISKRFKISTSNTTSNYSSNSISNSISLRHNFTFEAPGITQENELSYSFSHEYTFGQQSDETVSDESEDEFTILVPPQSTVPIKVIAYRNKMKIPYKALVKIFFNITFDGFLIKNKHVYTKDLIYYFRTPDFAHLKCTFGNDDISAVKDLNTQFIRKNIPDATPWDWNLLRSNRNPNIKSVLKNLFKEYAAELSGEFTKINSSNVIIEAGIPTPL